MNEKIFESSGDYKKQNFRKSFFVVVFILILLVFIGFVTYYYFLTQDEEAPPSLEAGWGSSLQGFMKGGEKGLLKPDKADLEAGREYREGKQPVGAFNRGINLVFSKEDVKISDIAKYLELSSNTAILVGTFSPLKYEFLLLENFAYPERKADLTSTPKIAGVRFVPEDFVFERGSVFFIMLNEGVNVYGDALGINGELNEDNMICNSKVADKGWNLVSAHKSDVDELIAGCDGIAVIYDAVDLVSIDLKKTKTLENTLLWVKYDKKLKLSKLDGVKDEKGEEKKGDADGGEEESGVKNEDRKAVDDAGGDADGDADDDAEGGVDDDADDDAEAVAEGGDDGVAEGGDDGVADDDADDDAGGVADDDADDDADGGADGGANGGDDGEDTNGHTQAGSDSEPYSGAGNSGEGKGFANSNVDTSSDNTTPYSIPIEEEPNEAVPDGTTGGAAINGVDEVDGVDEVIFPDPVLDGYIRELLKKQPSEPIFLNDPDLRNITLLEYNGLNSNHISDLSGLENMPVLQNIYFPNNSISDLTPLSGLSSLGELDLHQNRISDISPLSGVLSLEVLDLRRNQISDILPLSNLINLYYLVLDQNDITDPCPLSGGELSLRNSSLEGNPLDQELVCECLANIGGLSSNYHYYTTLHCPLEN